jgi:hypothetical protein
MMTFLLTAVISVVTGGTSLSTVPVMMQCGFEPHVAVATNTLALVFLSLGGRYPSSRTGLSAAGVVPEHRRQTTEVPRTFNPVVHDQDAEPVNGSLHRFSSV